MYLVVLSIVHAAPGGLDKGPPFFGASFYPPPFFGSSVRIPPILVSAKHKKKPTYVPPHDRFSLPHCLVSSLLLKKLVCPGCGLPRNPLFEVLCSHTRCDPSSRERFVAHLSRLFFSPVPPPRGVFAHLKWALTIFTPCSN